MRTLAASLLAAFASAKINQTDLDFINYMAKFGKSYNDLEEFNLRAAMFAKFDAEIKEINARETTSVHGHNFLSDWTAEEKTRLMGLKNMPRVKKTPTPEVEVDIVGIPTSVNWVSAGKVNAIQNQG